MYQGFKSHFGELPHSLSGFAQEQFELLQSVPSLVIIDFLVIILRNRIKPRAVPSAGKGFSQFDMASNASPHLMLFYGNLINIMCDQGGQTLSTNLTHTHYKVQRDI